MAQRRMRSREEYMREIDYIFKKEDEIREAVNEKREEEKRVDTIKLVSKGKISDPTGAEVIKKLTPLKFVIIKSGEIIEEPESWLEVVEKTYSYSKAQKDCRCEAARRRYRGEDYRKVCAELQISQAHFYRLIELVKMYAALQAVKKGLIEI